MYNNYNADFFKMNEMYLIDIGEHSENVYIGFLAGRQMSQEYLKYLRHYYEMSVSQDFLENLKKRYYIIIKNSFIKMLIKRIGFLRTLHFQFVMRKKIKLKYFGLITLLKFNFRNYNDYKEDKSLSVVVRKYNKSIRNKDQHIFKLSHFMSNEYVNVINLTQLYNDNIINDNLIAMLTSKDLIVSQLAYQTLKHLLKNN